MDCGDPATNFIKGFFSFLGDPVGTILEIIANFVLSAAVAVYAALITSVPTLTTNQADTSKGISLDTQWIVVYLAVGSLLFAAIRMAIERKGDAGKTALKGIMRVVLVSGAATTVVMAAASVGDSYSNYLFNAAVEESLQNVGACSGGGGITAFLLLILAFLLLISGIVHTILMYIRLGVMMLLLGTLPLAAAASMTDWGAGWWRKHIGWMIAWLLYKPAVALVLKAGIAMISAGGSGDGQAVNTRIAGIGVMLLSAIALPALLKLIVPATAAMGTGNPMSSMGQAGSNLASGAVMLGSRGGSSGGGSGPSGPSGATGSGGSSGSGGSTGGGGESGPGGGQGAGGAGKPGASGAGKGAAAAGPAGMAVLAATAAATAATQTVSGAIDGADGELGHNK